MMAQVKVVTDSGSDIPPEVARELGIAVIPLCIRFGDEVYRDGIDLSADDFYRRLLRAPAPPQTSTPSPGDFAGTYERLAAEAADIVSIHISRRYSGAINAAMVAADYAPEGCTVNVIDSKSASMGCGLLAIAAARTARAGASPEQVLQTVADMLPRTHIIGMIADINYLLGGRRLSLPVKHLRLGKLGSALRFKLVGEICEAGRVRGRGMYLRRATALARLAGFVREYPYIEDMAILHAQEPGWAQELAGRLGELPRNKLYQGRLGAATGVHGGPAAVAVAFTEGKERQ